MKKKHFLLILLFAFLKPIQAQIQLSVYSEISVITVGPGEVLFEKFGHSAIRIKDPVLQLDLIYNYGIFDFKQPNFYMNFAKGHLNYSLARYPFKYFKNSNKAQKRWVKQQVLNLTQIQKQAFFAFLENNALPENKDYLYDPYSNNCATKIHQITLHVLGDKVQFKASHLEKNLTFRALMDREIHWNSWGSFGINTALGSLDKIATSTEYMYLPDYVYSMFKNASVSVGNQPKKLVKKEEILLNFHEIPQKITFFSPFWVFCIIAIFGIFITYKNYKHPKKSKWLDFSLFFITGLMGVLLVFLWFFSSHSAAPNNLNILWAFAPNIFVSFIILKKKQAKWLKNYMLFLLFFLGSIPILWLTDVQQFPVAVSPLLLLLFVRYFYLMKYFTQK